MPGTAADHISRSRGDMKRRFLIGLSFAVAVLIVLWTIGMVGG